MIEHQEANLSEPSGLGALVIAPAWTTQHNCSETIPMPPNAFLPVLRDQLRRPLRDLRISVTDRCNFRCSYCMPKHVFGRGFRFLPHAEILSFEEIVRLARLFVGQGVLKLRLTGGEPLLRRDLSTLVRMLTEVGVEDLALTTNGSLLSEQVADLARAGLRRVTVSVDALDDQVFRRMSDADISVERVLAGIDAAASLGLNVKINAVVRRGVNEAEIVPLARYFREQGHVLRFIEYMDVGATNGWRPSEVVSAQEIRERLREHFALEPLEASYDGEVAERFRYADGSGEFGIIASVTKPFCGSCTRARLSAEGKLYTCLFATEGTDVRALLRSGASDSEIEQRIQEVWERRDDRYSEVRAVQRPRLPKIEMSYIGG
jgi:cyclic pyranopterin phosphate synthase